MVVKALPGKWSNKPYALFCLYSLGTTYNGVRFRFKKFRDEREALMKELGIEEPNEAPDQVLQTPKKTSKKKQDKVDKNEEDVIKKDPDSEGESQLAAPPKISLDP